MPSLSANHIAPAGGGYQPQFRHNWFLYVNGIDGLDGEQLRLSMVKAFLPTEENEIVELKFGNETVYVAGGIKFTEGEITVRDYIDKDIYGQLRAWRAMVADAQAGTVGFAGDYKKTARLVLTAPDDSSERSFNLMGLWPSKISPGALDYSTQTQTLEIGMTLKFDKAIAGA